MSLREIVLTLDSHETMLARLGVVPTARSTLADANRQRPAALFGEFLGLMIKRLHPTLRRKPADTVHLIDATPLSSLSGWVRFCSSVHGAKLHMIYDAHADCRLFAQVTLARVNDITVAQQMPIEPGATHVFDLGYDDYARWARLDQAGCPRFKKNTPLREPKERPLANDTGVLSDRLGLLPARQANNPFDKPVRANLMQKRPISSLLRPPDPSPQQPAKPSSILAHV